MSIETELKQMLQAAVQSGYAEQNTQYRPPVIER